ncbi:phospholipase [Dysgonomonas sp. 216]|uniref:patatin-like phospholipase family protein n=1 Tax=Dysgonomonas sp. 216 TaxID=2302934 RepID=UPI0013D4EAF3|nr:patatin-like phospholipase family protein [Dysgonomonas sp. 216]NDW17460.1 phospholipase [Dysgonomonas sp. 216]
MDEKQKHPLGLALSGGGSKGFAHLGVLAALDEIGLKPNIIAGTSAGAFAGVLYADGHSPKDILSFFQKKAFKEFAEFTLPQSGLFKTDRFKSFLKKHLRAHTFEELQIPLRVAATDIENGVSKNFDSGSLIPAVVASCSFPIVFTPIEIDGVHYVDGGLFKNFPVSLIRKQCEKIIGVNVSPITTQKYKNSLFYIAERSFHYISGANALIDRKLCDLLIEAPSISKYPMFSLDHSSEIYQLGYEAAMSTFEKNKDFIEKLTNISQPSQVIQETKIKKSV